MTLTIECVPAQPKTICNYTYGESFVHVSPIEIPNIPVAKLWTTRPCFLNAKYADFAEDIANFVVRPDDVWVVSFPKCGTTWTQEMVRLLNTDLDYDSAEKHTLDDYYTFIELSSIFDRNVVPTVSSVKRASEMSSPRYIKSHLPIELLPKSIWTVRPKIVFVSRNPKVAAVSYFHHYRNIHGYCGGMDEFMKAFLADDVIHAPFYDKVLNFWYSRNEPNILFLTYEQMQSDLMSVLRTTQRFLGKSFTDEQLERLSRHLHVDNMRENNSTNKSDRLAVINRDMGHFMDPDFRFIRRGVSGSFSSEMSPELIEMFDTKTRAVLQNTGFSFEM